MLEQEVVSERDLRGKADRVKSDVQRDLEDTLEQLRIANLNNDSKDKELKVNIYFLNNLLTIWNFRNKKRRSISFVSTSKSQRLTTKCSSRPCASVKTSRTRNQLRSMIT